MEQWIKIKGFENYSVSNFGNIRRDTSNRRGKAGKILKLGKNGRYLNVCLQSNGVEKTMVVHHLVAKAFIGYRPEGLQINHKDGVRFNNHVSNLEYVTARENTQHYIKLGLRKPILGESCHYAILKEKDILEIRNLYSQGFNQRIIAKKFNITFQNIHCITSRKTWKHI